MPYYARILDPERAKLVVEAFGSDRPIRLQGNKTHWGSFPGIDYAPYYLVDLEQFTPDELKSVVGHLAAKFGLTLEQAGGELAAKGIALLAENCEVFQESAARVESAKQLVERIMALIAKEIETLPAREQVRLLELLGDRIGEEQTATEDGIRDHTAWEVFDDEGAALFRGLNG